MVENYFKNIMLLVIMVTFKKLFVGSVDIRTWLNKYVNIFVKFQCCKKWKTNSKVEKIIKNEN